MDYSNYRFGRQIPEDARGLDWQNVDALREKYGSNTRYNQLQNYPNNITNIPITAMGGGYDTEDYIEQLMDGRPNNIMDMDAVRNISQNNLSLNDILANQFGSISRANQSVIPNQVYPQSTPKGFGRPYVMSIQEYQDNYAPYYGVNYQDIPQEEFVI